ncbi:MAG: hypothetical protein ACYS47_12395 [Planctomycetota bacterium]|jgi:hypothetical protein
MKIIKTAVGNGTMPTVPAFLALAVLAVLVQGCLSESTEEIDKL